MTSGGVVAAYRRKNRWKILRERLKHPWPFYRKVGGIGAVVIRADGTKEDLGQVANLYSRRWGVKSGSLPPSP